MVADGAIDSAPAGGSGLFLPVHVVADWLDRDLADALLDYAIARENAFTPGAIFYEGVRSVDPAQRNVVRLGKLGPFHSLLVERALAEKPNLERALGVPAFTASEVEIEMASHGEGAHFRRHIDTFVAGNRVARPRVLTLVFYLNRTPKAYSGGALRMHALGGTGVRDVTPEHNLLVAFPANAPHSVEPVQCPGDAFADRRFAVNIWIHA